MSDQMSTKETVAYALLQGLQYSFVEVIFMVLFALERFTGDGSVSPVLLWVSFIVAALWTLTTSQADAQEDAKQVVLDRWIFMSDFMVSAAVLCIAAALIWQESWWFPAMILIAAGQNLRYTYMSMQWLLEEKRERERLQRGDDDLPKL